MMVIKIIIIMVMIMTTGSVLVLDPLNQCLRFPRENAQESYRIRKEVDLNDNTSIAVMNSGSEFAACV